MTGFLKFVGTVNAAVWLGGVIAITLVAISAVFSKGMEDLLKVPGYPGAVAIVIFSRFFILQYTCGLLALLHALAGWLYLGRPLRILTNYLLLFVCALVVVGGFWLQPKIRSLHYEKYGASSTVARKEEADRSLKFYHATAEVLNVLALGGLIAYFWRVAYPNEPARFASLSKFRG